MRDCFSILTKMLSDLPFEVEELKLLAIPLLFSPPHTHKKVRSLGVTFVLHPLFRAPVTVNSSDPSSTPQSHMVTNNVSIYIKSRWAQCIAAESPQNRG